ncbi:hypothetical protein [Methanobrevibacter sp.]|uniref:hypothetical protein n=1 Tax=Methanobrevibacter sp. TaxID=66852 RepID=UPI0038659039
MINFKNHNQEVMQNYFALTTVNRNAEFKDIVDNFNGDKRINSILNQLLILKFELTKINLFDLQYWENADKIEYLRINDIGKKFELKKAVENYRSSKILLLNQIEDTISDIIGTLYKLKQIYDVGYIPIDTLIDFLAQIPTDYSNLGNVILKIEDKNCSLYEIISQFENIINATIIFVFNCKEKPQDKEQAGTIIRYLYYSAEELAGRLDNYSDCIKFFDFQFENDINS